MDPKTTTSLDPKLKDMYNRVMNTPIPPPVSPSPIQGEPIAPTQTPPTQPQPELNTPPAPQPETMPPARNASSIADAGGQPTIEVHAAIPLPSQPPRPVSAVVVGGSQNRSKLNALPILFALGAIIFFAAYAIFWIKFFNLQIPFLPF